MLIRVSDKGPGIANLGVILEGRYRSSTGMGLGIIGARRLVDQCDIQTAPKQGTAVVLKKMLPRRAPLVTTARLNEIVGALAVQRPESAFDEVRRQNQELLRDRDQSIRFAVQHFRGGGFPGGFGAPATNYAQPWLDGHYPSYDLNDRSQYYQPYVAPTGRPGP